MHPQTLRRWFAASIPLVLSACGSGPATPVGVTLDGGQVIVGQVTTEALVLEGALGPITVPLEDVGVVVPVEGPTLAASAGHVTVWLRNGSELRGKWRDPDLSMGVEVGGEVVDVELPTETFAALQLRGAESWPTGDLFRVRTTHGDDFLVDATASRVTLSSELGTFSPWLSECLSVTPVGESDGDWRLVLKNGSVLIGPLQHDAFQFALPMGPDTVAVPLASLASLQAGAWSSGGEGGHIDNLRPAMAGEVAPVADARGPEPAVDDSEFYAETPNAPAPPKARQAAPALSSGNGWFSHSALQSAKTL